MLYNTPALANHCSIRTTLVHFYILLQHYNPLLRPRSYSPYTFYPTPFTSIRANPGQEETRVWQHLYHYSLCTDLGSWMEWNTRRHFALHHFNPSLHTEPSALCLSGYTCTTILQWGFWYENRSLRQPQAGHHQFALLSLFSTRPDFLYHYGVGGFPAIFPYNLDWKRKCEHSICIAGRLI